MTLNSATIRRSWHCFVVSRCPVTGEPMPLGAAHLVAIAQQCRVAAASQAGGFMYLSPLAWEAQFYGD